MLATLLLVLFYALLSARFERAWISMPMVMVAVGFAIGVNGLGLVRIDLHSELVRTTAEITLALMLFHDAVRIDLRALRDGLRIPARLLGFGLPVMIVLGTAAAWGMFPSIGLAAAALIATMLAPTDAALGEAVVSDTRVPVSIRQGAERRVELNDRTVRAHLPGPAGGLCGPAASRAGLFSASSLGRSIRTARRALGVASAGCCSGPASTAGLILGRGDRLQSRLPWAVSSQRCSAVAGLSAPSQAE
jgi:hypothetical protein